MKKTIVTLLSVAMLFGTFTGYSGQAQAAGTQILTIGTADSTGTMYPVGAAIASVANDKVEGVKVNVETSPGSPANCVNIQAGNIQLATIAGDTAMQAANGLGAFKGRACPDLRAVCAVYASISNWIALKNSGLTLVNELGGKVVVVGPAASTTEISAKAGLAGAGVTPAETVNLGLGDGATEVGDGLRDAAHGFAGLPIGGQLSVAQTKDCVFLGYTDAELDAIIKANPSYYKTTIPAGTYPGQDADVATFGTKALIVVNANMDEKLVYEITKAINSSISDLTAAHASMKAMLDPKFISNDLSIELHPGAAKYYKEQGMIK